MKPLRVLLVAFAVVIVAGTIASATAGGVHGKPTPSPSVAVSDAPSAEHAETEAPEAGATTSGATGRAPNFSACNGLIGLNNAICRHDALAKVKPDIPGLAKSLAHLQANLAAQADREATSTRGKSESHSPSGS